MNDFRAVTSAVERWDDWLPAWVANGDLHADLAREAQEEFFGWEQIFIDRGLATFSFDGPGQGETGLHSSIYPDYERAVSPVLDALDGFERVGVAGVSLGGYYAPRAAAYEKRIRAAAGISGPFNFGDCWGSLPQPTRETIAHHTGASSVDEARTT